MLLPGFDNGYFPDSDGSAPAIQIGGTTACWSRPPAARACARHGMTGHLAQLIAAWQLSAADLRHGGIMVWFDRWHPADLQE
jgi:hypothetical protein